MLMARNTNKLVVRALMLASLMALSACASGTPQWNGGADYKMTPNGPVGILGPTGGIF